MKKKLKLVSELLEKQTYSILLIVVLGLIYITPLFTPGLFQAHDSEPQVIRIGQVFNALSDGHFPARWAGNANFNFGVPSPNFFFPLMGYLGSILHFIGFTLADSYKLLIGAAFIGSGVTFYMWLRRSYKGVGPLVGAFAYMLAPYHFLDLYVRGQLGELLALFLVPLVLYFIDGKPTLKNVILGAISYSLLVTSHNILALTFTALIVGYILVKRFDDRKSIAYSLSILLLGLILSAFFWVPALYESRYINSKLFVADFYLDNFVANLSHFFLSSWGFGDSINSANGLSPMLGPVHVALVFVGLFYIFVTKNWTRLITYWVVVLTLFLFLSTEYSNFLWSKIHVLAQFQFPWRLVGISSFAASVLIAIIFSKKKNNYIALLSLLAILIYGLFFVKVNGYKILDDDYYLNHPSTGAYHGESTTVWTAGDMTEYPNENVEVINGTARILNYTRKTHKRGYTIASEGKSRILDNTVYFPGWTVLVNGEKVPIEFQDMNYRGLITYNVGEGESSIQVVFNESPIRLAADLISVLGVLVVVVIIIFSRRINEIFKK